MFIDFEKWHGAKNDFIVTWILTPDKDMLVPTLSRLAPKLCSRDGSGIAADGILVLVSKSRKDPHPEELVIINADGSLAKNCGNGLRCAAMSARRRAHREGVLDFDGVTMTVQGTGIDCRFMGHESNPFVAVAMPIPVVGQSNTWTSEVTGAVRSLQSANPDLKGDVETVSLGNPHVVITVEDATADLAKIAGKPLQTVRGGDGINVHVASSLEITDKDRQQARKDLGEELGELFQVFPWERGVGPTQACGTGACAVGVAALATGLAERSLWIGIEMPGGRLYAKQDSEDDIVTLAGPATFVFAGTIEI
jgi:diaminopimelate epimerase